MASYFARMTKQDTVGKNKCITLTVPQKLQQLGGLKLMKAKVWLCLHTALDHQLSVIQGTGGLIMDICGIKWKCAGSFQVTGNTTATIGQGAV